MRSGLRRVVSGISGACAALGALALVCLMLLTCVDVVRRKLTGESIAGVIELAPLLLLAAVALGLGHGEITGTHVRTTLVTGRLPARVRPVVRMTGYLVCIALLAWITNASFDRAVDAYDFNDTTAGFESLPTWQVRALVPVGFSLFALALALRFLDDLDRLRGRQAPQVKLDDPAELGPLGDPLEAGGTDTGERP